MNCVFTFLATITERKNEGPIKITGVEAVCRAEQRVLSLFFLKEKWEFPLEIRNT